MSISGCNFQKKRYNVYKFIKSHFLLCVVSLDMKAKDLAKKLGVSPATISLVLNNKPGVSQSLRHSLIEQIKDLGYGDMLAGGSHVSTPTANHGQARASIAYLIYTSCDESNDRFAFYPAVLEGAEMEARDSNYNLVVLHMGFSGNANLRQLLDNSGDVMGAIVQANNLDDAILQDVRSLDIPCVFVDSYRPDIRTSSVCVNNEQGIFSVVKYLKEKGHRDIGYVYSGWDHDSQLERRRCFHQALREFGLEDRREYYFKAGPTEDYFGLEPLEEALKKVEHMPTALVGENDRQAWRAVKALQRLGLKVPDDVSVVGFDNRSICTMIEPNLTSVRNYRHLMGRECVMLLENLRRMKKLGIGDPCVKFELPTELVERDSVRDLTKTAE